MACSGVCSGMLEKDVYSALLLIIYCCMVVLLSAFVLLVVSVQLLYRFISLRSPQLTLQICLFLLLVLSGFGSHIS